MNRILFSGGFLAGEVIGQAGVLWMHTAPAVHPGWLLVGGISILISVQRVANAIFAHITEETETVASPME